MKHFWSLWYGFKDTFTLPWERSSVLIIKAFNLSNLRNADLTVWKGDPCAARLDIKNKMNSTSARRAKLNHILLTLGWI